MADNTNMLAVDTARRRLDEQKQAYGDDHPETLIALTDLATAYRQAGDYASALELLDRALLGCLAVLGSEAFETERVELQSGSVLYCQGEYERARPIQEKIAERWITKYGIDDEATDSCITNLAMTLRQSGDIQALNDLEERVVQLWVSRAGESNAGTLKAMARLASTKRLVGEFKSAKVLDSAVIERALSAGLSLRNVIDAKRNLADDLIGLKEWRAASRLQSEIYKDAQLLPDDDGLRKVIQSNRSRLGYKISRRLSRN